MLVSPKLLISCPEHVLSPRDIWVKTKLSISGPFFILWQNGLWVKGSLGVNLALYTLATNVSPEQALTQVQNQKTLYFWK